jgi:hypothetical protein
VQTGTLKTSTIFVAVGDRTQIFRSVNDIPLSLREALIRSTTGSSSATILIADRNGKDELVRAIQGLPSSIPLRITEETRRKQKHRDKVDRARARHSWLEIGLIGVLGLLLWSLAVWK